MGRRNLGIHQARLDEDGGIINQVQDMSPSSVVCTEISEKLDIVTVDEFGGMSQINLQETRVNSIRGKLLAPLMFSMRLAVEALRAAQIIMMQHIGETSMLWTETKKSLKIISWYWQG
ncbi:hypothetical protein I7I51_04113 [Histoplasma capsulatum]|uniref:Uncharacterized protein n=1 Tax=Ajellomyces capsulatus TaxID=5037 RepID=A0A8A1M5Z9_AJECA|nr:hypothetical protein I7I51_04113 [Histoplasma capsulatum]